MKDCRNCGHALKFESPPSPGGPHDGVLCSCKNMAYAADALLEYEAEGSVNIWRVEVVTPGAECRSWTPATTIRVGVNTLIIAWNWKNGVPLNEVLQALEELGGGKEVRSAHIVTPDDIDENYILVSLLEVARDYAYELCNEYSNSDVLELVDEAAKEEG